MDTVKIPLKIFTTYEALQEYYGDRNDLELGMYESDDTLVVGHAPNAYSFNPQFFTGENNYVPDYIPASPITHMVTALSDNTAYGYTSGSGLYSEHTYATVKATAYDGYTFTNWSNGVETSAYTLLVENDVELTAYFEAGSQPTEPPTEPPTPEPTTTETPSGNIALMYVRPKYSYYEDEETGQITYNSNYVNNLWYGVQDPADPNVNYAPGRIYLRMEDAPGQVLLKSELEYETEDGGQIIGVHEYFDIDATNNEITVTTYLLGEEDSHQLLSSTYTVSEYNAAFYATDEEIDFGCGSPAFPIQQEFNQDEIESYLTTEMGATGLGSAVVTSVELREVENTNVLIPTAVLDDENELLYDEDTSNISAVITTMVSPNLTDPDYVEGIFWDNNYVGIIDTEEEIDSTDHPNNALDRFAELDYIDYKVLSGQHVNVWDVTGDGLSVLMHAATSEESEIPLAGGHYMTISVPIFDENDPLTVIDNVLVEFITKTPDTLTPAVKWTIRSTAQTPLFSPITQVFGTVSDYLTEYNYTDVLTINGTEFIEINLYDTILAQIENELSGVIVDLRMGDIRYGNDRISYFVRVHNTDETSEYYDKDYNLFEADITGEDYQWDMWISSNMEILNFNTACEIIYHYDGNDEYYSIEALPHRTVAINE